tara:strand:- start:56 stop:250 length:195 start_codon:yes stop_codon:yes gene_type:complete
MFGIGIKNIFYHELSHAKRTNIKKMIKIVLILELEKKLFNETLPSSQKSKLPKDKNARCTGHKK